MICRLCNKKMKVVNNLHLERIHGISSRQYKEMFPDAETHDLDVRKRMSTNISKALLGQKLSEERKRNMSIARKNGIKEGRIITPFMSEDKTGENNPAWGSNRRSKREIDATREKNSEIMSELAIAGKFSFDFGQFLSEKLNKKFNYRSLYELRFFTILEHLDFVHLYDYESIRIPYIYDGIKRHYVPDFFVEFIGGRRCIVEVGTSTYKVHVDGKTKAKQDATVEYCKKRGFEFFIATEYTLYNLENMKNSVNCWNDLKPFFHNVIGNDKRDGLKNKRIYG